jgi:hypothetical protein
MELWTSTADTISRLDEIPPGTALLVLAALALIGIALRSALSEWEAREALVRMPNGQIIAANAAAARLTGHAIEDLQRLDLGALFPFDSPTDWLREVRTLGQTSMTAVALRRKYGTTATVEVDAAFLRQGREKVVQMVFRPAAATPSSDAGTVPATGALASPFSLTSSFPTPPRAPEPAPLSPATVQAPAGRGAASPLLRQITEAVSQHFGVQIEEIIGTRHTPQLTLARRVTMYLALEVAGANATETGRFLGGRSEVAVIYGARCLADAMEQDAHLRQQVKALAARLRRPEAKGATARG